MAEMKNNNVDKIPNGEEFDGVNASSNYTYAPDFIIKISWLQKRNQILSLMTEYRIRKHYRSSTEPIIAKMFAKNIELYIDLEPALRRSWKTKKAEDLKKLISLIYSARFEDIVTCFKYMNYWLDEVGVTKVDTRVKAEYESITDEIDSENN